MKKYTLVAICSVLSFMAANAQNLTPKQVKMVFKGIDTVVASYAQCGTLLEKDQLKISDAAKSRYLEIFKDTMTNVYGDLMNEKNSEMVKEGKKPKFIILPIKDYLTKTSMKFRYGLKIKIVNIDADLHSMKNNTIRVFVEQKITGIKSKGKEVENQDTIAMNIEFKPDLTSAKITDISPTGLGGHITVTNADMDEIDAKKKALKKGKK